MTLRIIRRLKNGPATGAANTAANLPAYPFKSLRLGDMVGVLQPQSVYTLLPKVGVTTVDAVVASPNNIYDRHNWEWRMTSGAGTSTATTDIYADPAGDDANPGTLALPVRTLRRALALQPGAPRGPVVIHLAAGSYLDALTLPIYATTPIGPAAAPLAIVGGFTLNALTPTPQVVQNGAASSTSVQTLLAGGAAGSLAGVFIRFPAATAGQDRWLIADNTAGANTTLTIQGKTPFTFVLGDTFVLESPNAIVGAAANNIVGLFVNSTQTLGFHGVAFKGTNGPPTLVVADGAAVSVDQCSFDGNGVGSNAIELAQTAFLWLGGLRAVTGGMIEGPLPVVGSTSGCGSAFLNGAGLRLSDAATLKGALVMRGTAATQTLLTVRNNSLADLIGLDVNGEVQVQESTFLLFGFATGGTSNPCRIFSVTPGGGTTGAFTAVRSRVLLQNLNVTASAADGVVLDEASAGIVSALVSTVANTGVGVRLLRGATLKPVAGAIANSATGTAGDVQVGGMPYVSTWASVGTAAGVNDTGSDGGFATAAVNVVGLVATTTYAQVVGLNALAGMYVRVVTGPAIGQRFKIVSNTAGANTALTLEAVGGLVSTNQIAIEVSGNLSQLCRAAA